MHVNVKYEHVLMLQQCVVMCGAVKGGVEADCRRAEDWWNVEKKLVGPARRMCTQKVTGAAAKWLHGNEHLILSSLA